MVNGAYKATLELVLSESESEVHNGSIIIHGVLQCASFNLIKCKC